MSFFECPIQPKKSSTYNYERILTYVHGTSYLPTFICPRVGFRNFYQYFLCVSFKFFNKFQFLFFFSLKMHFTPPHQPKESSSSL